MSPIIYQVRAQQNYTDKEVADHLFKHLLHLCDTVTLTVLELKPGPGPEERWEIIESKEITTHA